MTRRDTSTESRQEFFKLFIERKELLHEIGAEQAGKLIRAVLEYGNDGTMPELDDEMMMHFLMMKAQSDQDAENYENIRLQNSANAKKRFANRPPTLEEVSAFFKEETLEIDPVYFFNYYQARDWRVNGTKLADWKAQARAWNANGNRNTKNQTGVSSVLDYID